MLFLINLATKCKTNLRNYLRNNNLKEIYLRNYLQDMHVNIIRKIKISSRIFVIRIITIITAIITINTTKTSTNHLIIYLSNYFVAHVC